MPSSNRSARPYQDEETLRRLYRHEHLSTREIAKEFGCSKTTIGNWLDEYNIERRSRSEAAHHRLGFDEVPWCDEAKLYELYWEQGMSSQEIAEELGCNRNTIWKWMDEYDIPRRDQAEAVSAASRVEWAPYCVADDYETWCDEIAGEQVRVSQLLAIADGADPHDVFDPDTVCHHTTHHPRDNRRGVIEVLSRSEHGAYHAQQEIPEWKQDLIQMIERESK